VPLHMRPILANRKLETSYGNGFTVLAIAWAFGCATLVRGCGAFENDPYRMDTGAASPRDVIAITVALFLG
jgi:hypothetical protein